VDWGLSSKNIKPEEEAPEIDGGSKGGKPPGVARCDAWPLLDVRKGVFHQMALSQVLPHAPVAPGSTGAKNPHDGVD